MYKQYLVYFDESGLAIGRPRLVEDGCEVDLEVRPEGAVSQEVNTKEAFLKHDYGLMEEDFEDE